MYVVREYNVHSMFQYLIVYEIAAGMFFVGKERGKKRKKNVQVHLQSLPKVLQKKFSHRFDPTASYFLYLQL